MAAMPNIFQSCRAATIITLSSLRTPSVRCLSTFVPQLRQQSTRLAMRSSVKIAEIVKTNQVSMVREYSAKPPLDKTSIEKRVLLCLSLYDKINPDEVSLESRFKEDLSLDSLDHVEIIMAMEDEFGFEIPDQDAEHLHTPAKIVQYIMDKEDVYEGAH